VASKIPAENPTASLRRPQQSTGVVKETKAERLASAAAEWTKVQAGEATIGAGLLAGLPSLPEGDMWLDVTWTSVIIGGTPETTINYWVSLGKPVHNPFPRPHQYLRTNLWKLSEVLTWAQAEGILADLPALPPAGTPCPPSKP
jgi:hypothetical protein